MKEKINSDGWIRFTALFTGKSDNVYKYGEIYTLKTPSPGVTIELNENNTRYNTRVEYSSINAFLSNWSHIIVLP